MSKICQSCSMPLPDATKHHGTNEDGSINPDCHHCYQNGHFTEDLTVDQMIERCVPFLSREMGEQRARAMLAQKLPKLKRWA